MNPKPLLIAVVVLSLLGGAVYYTQENPPTADDERPGLFSAEEEQIAELTIKRPEKEPLQLKRGEDEKWQFVGIDVPADDGSVGFLLTNLNNLNADRVVEEEVADWAPFGLAGDGKLSVDVKLKEGEGGRLIFGNDTPTGAGVYARKDGEPKLYTVYSYVKSGFEKEVFDLRQKKLIQTDESSISRVTLNVGAKSYEFGKGGNDKWQILKPQPLRADNFTVGDLVRSARNAEMSAVLSDGAGDADKYSFAKPYAELEIVDQKGPHHLTIAKTVDNTYYAKSSDMAGVYEVSSTMAEGLNKDLQEFRNKKLYDFGFDDPAKVEIQDGDRKLVITKKEDKWVLASDADRELESGKVQTLIDNLRSLTATGFSSDNAADQAKYGLTAPAITATVAPTGEAAAETVLISSPGQERVYAARMGEPTIYEVEKAPVEEIQRSIEAALRPAEEKKETPEEP